MKALIVYYSRTGTTRKLAQAIHTLIDSDMEEIIDTVKRSGILGYIRSGFQGLRKKLTAIEKTRSDPSKYDITIIGTPVWVGTMTPAIKTYIHEQEKQFMKVAFFSTYGGKDTQNAFSDMGKLCGKQPVSLLGLRRKEVDKGDYIEKVRDFLSEMEA